jgi:hypothetical protein
MKVPVSGIRSRLTVVYADSTTNTNYGWYNETGTNISLAEMAIICQCGLISLQSSYLALLPLFQLLLIIIAFISVNTPSKKFL